MITQRLREAATHALMSASRQTVLEAADEIDRLRSLTRFQDGVIRSGAVATLTEEEREAVTNGMEALIEDASITSMFDDESAQRDTERAAVLGRLLERLKVTA